MNAVVIEGGSCRERSLGCDVQRNLVLGTRASQQAKYLWNINHFSNCGQHLRYYRYITDIHTHSHALKTRCNMQARNNQSRTFVHRRCSFKSYFGVQYLAQGHLDIQYAGAGDGTNDLHISWATTLHLSKLSSFIYVTAGDKT